MQLIESDPFQTLLEHVGVEAPDLLTACRWLAFDPRTAALVFGEDAHRPSPADFSQLLEVLDTAPQAVAEAGHALLTARSRLLAELDVALERLIAAGEQEWSHPTEILGRPCPDFAQLLTACEARLEAANGDGHRHLESVRERLERAVRIEAKARRRRERSTSRR